MKKFPRLHSERLNRFDYQLSNFSYLLFLSVANTLLFQGPLYVAAACTRDGFDLHSGLALSSLFVLQMMVSMSVFGVASIMSMRFLKILCGFLFVVNSAALYFIVQYHVILDSTMIGNILHTNLREAYDYAHPKLIAYVVCLGVAPAILIARVRIKSSSRLRRAACVLFTLLFGSAWLYANAQSWLWIDKNAKQLGGLVLPWSYAFNTVRFLEQEAERRGTPKLLPPATHLNAQGAIVVLVIGESARAQNYSLYGYGRLTNPLLAKSGAIVFAGAHSCATYTTAALRCMLSSTGAHAAYGNDEPLPSYLYRHGVEVLWRTNNFGEPLLQVTSYQRADQLRAQCTGDCSRAAFDEVLLRGLAQRLHGATSATKTLVVLHLAGSHGPQYSKKYPPQFEKFMPVCRSVELQKCTPEELINAYDNTIVYNDYFLNQVIELLKAVKTRPSVLVYMSDHGESLGEHGLYLHGVPMAIAPEVQFAVPLLVWMSDQFVSARPPSVAASGVPGPAPSQGLVFHSVMGALGLTSDAYLAEQDLFRPAHRASPPLNSPSP